MSERISQQAIERARLLLRQKRYKDAETQAGIALQQNPDDPDALQIIGHCRLDTKKYDEAVDIFKKCLGLQPADDYVQYLLAFCYYQKNQLDVSKRYLDNAIAIFPYNAGYFALLSNIYCSQRKYSDALYAANQGLNVNAEDISCLNARTTALFRLNKKDEAYETINEALQADPEDAFTHTNYGWHYLEKGKYKKAYEHFKESLRINPNSNAAKEGYKASLKAKLPFYRWMLQYSLWLSQQSGGVRVAIVFGLWIVVRLIASFIDSETEWLKYVAIAVILLYLGFVFLSWLGNSLANLYLLATPHGKMVLDSSEKWSARCVGLSLLAGTALIVAAIFAQPYAYLLTSGGIIASLSIPFSFIEFPIQLFKGKGILVTAQIAVILGLLASLLVFIVPVVAGFIALVYYCVLFFGLIWGKSYSRL